ncbi:hypothetical protein Fmac_002764 [Flemingia macrophylla]|uniref:Uncharacterized protein n=1 Tax=Flemingia macrophylla TaxID=520843 RepID=A0ABD1NKU2_9FABA
MGEEGTQGENGKERRKVKKKEGKSELLILKSLYPMDQKHFPMVGAMLRSPTASIQFCKHPPVSTWISQRLVKLRESNTQINLKTGLSFLLNVLSSSPYNCCFTNLSLRL